MGVGDPPLEAPFALKAPIPAGMWHLVGDGIVFAPVDVTFDLLWRSSAGDVALASVTHHFVPRPSGFDAVPYETTIAGIAADAQAGDQLVLRISAANTTGSMTYIPDGDGARAHGRIPYVDLP